MGSIPLPTIGLEWNVIQFWQMKCENNLMRILGKASLLTEFTELKKAFAFFFFWPLVGEDRVPRPICPSLIIREASRYEDS